jgi:hypothetical protein
MHRLDQRLEKRRLLRELVLDLEVSVALDEDQVDGDERGGGDRREEPQRSEHRDTAARVQDRGDRGERDRADQEAGPNR